MSHHICHCHAKKNDISQETCYIERSLSSSVEEHFQMGKSFLALNPSIVTFLTFDPSWNSWHCKSAVFREFKSIDVGWTLGKKFKGPVASSLLTHMTDCTNGLWWQYSKESTFNCCFLPFTADVAHHINILFNNVGYSLTQKTTTWK